MSRTSEYTIDLIIKNDKTKDAIRELEKSMKGVGEIAKKSIGETDFSKSLEASQKAADAAIAKFHEMAKGSELDFDAISKAYAKSSKKAFDALESQYARMKDQLDARENEYRRLTQQLQEQKRTFESIRKIGGVGLETEKAIRITESELVELGYSKLKAQITQNQQVRWSLNAAEQVVSLEKNKMQCLKATEKQRAASDKNEKKSLADRIRQQIALVKTVFQTEKAQKACGKQQEAVTKAIEKSSKETGKWSSRLQFAYNVSGLFGGAGRLIGTAGKAAIGGGSMIARGISAGVSTVAQGAEQEVEREQQANRIKSGGTQEERIDLLRQVYLRTGADNSASVDAINRVYSALGKNISKDELISAAENELRYPGMVQAFAATITPATSENFTKYANRMRAIQQTTGASAEQVQASSQAVSTLLPNETDGASQSELQAVYLGLQNSGSFNSQEELDAAFKRFARKRDKSENIFDAAQKFDWTRGVSVARNRLQVENGVKNIDWGTMKTGIAAADNQKTPEKTQAETMAMKMREIEEKKNQLLMKLIPSVLPVVEGLARLMESKGDKIVNGIVALFDKVIPLLEPVFDALDVFLGVMTDTILPLFKWLVDKFAAWFGEQDPSAENAIPKNANGGIVWGKSIVGERGAEAVIPLDFSRAQRAENIAFSIQNHFSMTGNQTTALSLSEAVASRDFSRAMSKAAFKAGRMGVF